MSTNRRDIQEPHEGAGSREDSSVAPEAGRGSPDGPEDAWDQERSVGVRGRLPRAFRVSFLLRGIVLWFGIRLAMAFTRVASPEPPPPAGLSPFQGLVLVPIIVYVAVLVDQRIRREHVLLGNAGVPPWVGPAHAVAVATIVEAAVQLGVALGSG